MSTVKPPLITETTLPFTGVAGLIRMVQVIPDLEFLRLFPREHEVAVRVFRGLEQHFKLVAGLECLELLFGVNCSTGMMPSDLYPRSSITTPDRICNTRPRTTVPDLKLFKDWS